MTSYLLDTHVAIWWGEGNLKLSQKSRDLIGDDRNDIYLSPINVWEVAIKMSHEKISLRSSSPGEYFSKLLESNGFKQLPVMFSHALVVYDLPKIHDDPFDRLLIAQAISEKITLITDDKYIKQYDVNTVY